MTIPTKVIKEIERELKDKEWNLSDKAVQSGATYFDSYKIKVKDVKEFIRREDEIDKKRFSSLLSSILLWFLSDNIKVNEERLKRLFESELKLSKSEKLKLAGEKLK